MNAGPQKSVLGKGLASLLPGASAKTPEASMEAPPVTASSTTVKDRQMGVSLLPLGEIRINPYQPRREFNPQQLEELAQSIRENGLIQPLVVRKQSDGYELIAGERRLRASRLAGLQLVPVVIRKSTDKESLEIALIENIQRQELNCVEEAQAYLRLIQEFKLTQDEVAMRVGKERATVANMLRLLQLPEQVLEDLKSGRLSAGHGKVLLSLEDPASRAELRRLIIETAMSVRAAEKWAQDAKMTRTNAKASSEPSENPAIKLRLSTISQNLTRRFSTRVELSGDESSGKITLYYSGRENLDRILGQLQSSS